MQNHEPIWFDKKEVNLPQHRIFVATPCHSDLTIHYTQSVLELQKYCMQQKIGIMIQLFKSSLVTQGRNLCVANFLSSDCTHLLFIDSDIAVRPTSIFNLLEADKDINDDNKNISIEDDLSETAKINKVLNEKLVEVGDRVFFD